MQFNVFSKLKKITPKEILDVKTENKNVIQSFTISEKYPVFSYGISSTDQYKCLGKRMKFELQSDLEFMQFKDHLSYMVGFSSQQELVMHDGPVFFQELIKFDEKEAVIGPVICKKLFNDFKDNYDNAESYFNRLEESEQKFWVQYKNWCKALFVAKQSGAISVSID